MKRSLAVILALLLCACGTTGDKKDETTGWSAEKLYQEAKDEIAVRGYTKAIKYLETIEARFPYGRYAQQAQIDLAYVHYKEDDKASAIAACERFIKLHPNHAAVDYIYYLKGLVNFNEDLGIMGKISRQDLTERDPKAARDSFDAFRELVTRYPDSKYAPDAIARMQYLVNSLASYEIHVARYYMKRGAYVAAVNRAQYAIQNYGQAPAIEEALFVMVKAYHAMGIPALRDDADRVLQRNFPDSAYFKNTGGTKDPWWMLWSNAW